MKATTTSTLVVGTFCLFVLAMLGDEALAQVKPEAVRPEANTPALKERSDVPRPPDAPAPSDDPAMQDEAPVVPGACPDQGRKLQLIV